MIFFPITLNFVFLLYTTCTPTAVGSSQVLKVLAISPLGMYAGFEYTNDIKTNDVFKISGFLVHCKPSLTSSSP